MTNEWNIQAHARNCRACGRPFADQQVYHTLLFDERGQYRREDVCADCWQSQFSQGATDRQGFISHWQGVHQTPPPVGEAIRKETAETLLRQLTQRNEPQHLAAMYILAVMLERKRLLKIKDQVLRDGQRVFLYEHVRTGDLFTIPDPNLRVDRLQEVQRDVAALLERGVVSAGPVASSPTSEAPTFSPSAPCPAQGPADSEPGVEVGSSS